MVERFDSGIRFKKIDGAKPRPKVVTPKKPPKPEPVKPPEPPKPEPVKPPEPPKPEPVKLPEPPKPEPINPPEMPKPEPIKFEPTPEPIKPLGPPKIEIILSEKVKTGVFIPVPDMFDKISNVYLNNSCLNAKTDYSIQEKNICFSFNVRKNERITIVGFLPSI